MKSILTPFCFIISFCSNILLAVPQDGVSAVDRKQVSTALDKLSKAVGQKFYVSDVKLSPINGLFEVTSDMNIFYISKDGRYLMSGEMLDLTKDKKSWALTEQASREIRKKILSALDVKDMIVFKAKKPKIGTVTVFTDIDCHYCERLQTRIKEYTDLGIELRYMAFPRSGPNTPSFDKAITVWCSSDRQRDYTLATQGKELPKNICKNNPVAMQFELARRMGVNGTPTILLENGIKIGGLLQPTELAKVLKEEGN